MGGGMPPGGMGGMPPGMGGMGGMPGMGGMGGMPGMGGGGMPGGMDSEYSTSVTLRGLAKSRVLTTLPSYPSSGQLDG